VFKVKGRIYGEAADGRTVLLFSPGAVITDDEARRAGLLLGEPAAQKPARGLVIHDTASPSDEAPPAKPLARMNLAELRAVSDAEGVDVEGLNLRAELIEAIEAAREPEAGTAGAED